MLIFLLCNFYSIFLFLTLTLKEPFYKNIRIKNSIKFKKFFFFFWHPLFMRKSYYLVFSLKNNLIRYCYEMLYFVFYNIYKKLFNFRKSFTMRLILGNIFLIDNYVFRYFYKNFFKKTYLLIRYLWIICWSFIFFQTPFFIVYLCYLSCTSPSFFYNYISYGRTFFLRRFYSLKKKFFHKKYNYKKNLGIKKNFKKVLYKKFFFKRIFKKKTKQLVSNIKLKVILKKIFFFKLTSIFKKFYKFLNSLNLKIIFSKKKFFIKHFFISFVLFLKKFTKKKFFFYLTRSCVLSRFLKNSLKIFVSKNKKYLKILKKKKTLKVFFLLFTYSIMYKSLISVKYFLKKFLNSIPLKKQRFLFYFLRFNLMKLFKNLYKWFNVLGVKLVIRGKFSTLVGGRKKNFSCFFRRTCPTNYFISLKSVSVKTSTKLGSSNFLLLFSHF